MMRHARRPPRPRPADVARFFAYLALSAWSAAFILFPPVAFVSAIDYWTRVLWLSVTGLSAATAAIGAILRIDLRVELPALHVLLVGPGLYFLSQVYLVLDPPAAVNPTQRIALAFFVLYGTLAPIPRLIELREVRAQTKAAKRNAALAANLTAEQNAQPGAFPELEVRDVSDDPGSARGE